MMKFKLENYLPDIPSLVKKMPRYYDFIAVQITLPELGKVWYIHKTAFSSVLNGYQYAIKEKDHYLLAEHYPQNSYLIVNSQTKKLSVVRSIMLTYAQDRIIARRKSIGNVPIWELIDPEYIRNYRDIQHAFVFEDTLFADSYKEETCVVKHLPLKRTIAVNGKFQHTTPQSTPSIEKLSILRYNSANAVTHFHHYFSTKDEVINFIDVTRLERGKITNTSFNEVFTVGAVLHSLKSEGFDIEKEVAIVTISEEQKHILADFFADTIGHSSDRPKIALPHEIRGRTHNVVIFSFAITSKADKYSNIDLYEHDIRLLIDSVKDGIIFIGNMRLLHRIYGFSKELAGLIKALRRITPITSWISGADHHETMMNLWKEPIKKMNPEKTADLARQPLWNKYYQNILQEFEKKNIPAMKSIYKDYLRSLGIGKIKKS
jgi:hypothetical protein